MGLFQQGSDQTHRPSCHAPLTLVIGAGRRLACTLSFSPFSSPPCPPFSLPSLPSCSHLNLSSFACGCYSGATPPHHNTLRFLRRLFLISPNNHLGSFSFNLLFTQMAFLVFSPCLCSVVMVLAAVLISQYNVKITLSFLLLPLYFLLCRWNL